MLLSPLEQFEIISLLSIKLFNFDFSFTNSLLINIVTLIFFSSIVYFLSSDTNYLNETPFYVIPNSWQIFIEMKVTGQLRLPCKYVAKRENKELRYYNEMIFRLLKNLEAVYRKYGNHIGFNRFGGGIFRIIKECILEHKEIYETVFFPVPVKLFAVMN